MEMPRADKAELRVAAARGKPALLDRNLRGSSLLRSGHSGTVMADIVRLLPMVTRRDKLSAIATPVLSFALASVLSCAVVLIPLAAPSAGLRENWVFVLVYFGLNTAFYAWSVMVMMDLLLAFSMPIILTGWGRLVGPLVFGLISAGCYCLTSAALSAFPVALAFIPFLFNLFYIAGPLVVLVLFAFDRCRCCAALCRRLSCCGQQWFRLRNGGVRCVHVVAIQILFTGGWALGISYIHVFKGQPPMIQNLMVVALHVWKVSAILTAQFFIEMTGAFDVSVQRAFCSAATHWFWIMFSNLVFISIEETTTFVIFLLLDFLQTLVAAMACSAQAQRWMMRAKLVGAKMWRMRRSAARIQREMADPQATRTYVYSDTIHFFVIQLGEILLAAHAAFMLVVHRYSPYNSQYYAVSSAKISDAVFTRAIAFNAIACAAEACTFPITCVLVYRCVGRLDVLAIAASVHKSEWRISNVELWAALGAVCVVPLNLLVVDHAGLTGFTLFDDRRGGESSNLTPTPTPTAFANGTALKNNNTWY